MRLRNAEKNTMVRGIYTAASGMTAQQHRMDAIANNLANVDTTGFKRDVAVHKAFPELLLRRMSDEGVIQFPLRGEPVGSVDKSPVVGRIGTGVEQNEVFTIFEQGAVQYTENPFDLALDGGGFFVVDTPNGSRLTRDGAFTLGAEGLLVTQHGYPVLDENGLPIELKENNFRIDSDGRVFINARFGEDPNRLVSQSENEWDDAIEIARLQVVGMDQPRYLQKQGQNLYRTTPDSGDAFILNNLQRPTVLQGFIEKSNVNVISEMVQMIEVNRAYEANQRVIHTHDSSTNKLLNEALRL